MILIATTDDTNPMLWREEMARAFGDDRVFLSDKFPPDQIHYLMAWKADPDLPASLASLKAIFSLGAGVDHLLPHKENLPDVPVIRVVNDDLTQDMVHYILWRVLAIHRRDKDLTRAQAKHQWLSVPISYQARDLSIGILGCGHLGRATAKHLSALGFRVRGWTRQKQNLGGIEAFYGWDQLREFLSESHILISLLPLTEETKGLINQDFLENLPRTTPFGAPALINAGRGGLQDEEALLHALNKGRLSHISLDVFNEEPLPSSSPLWAHPDVYLTPHIAAQSNPHSICKDIISAIHAYESGEKLRHTTDLSRGY